ncbi:hypothetical protein C7I85_24020 [Mesorhizobium soli]|uniref:Uncharacterized protein n=1 Tax=Pseudaminobacter soli (ex Li et al. 2025) TaxID=1295366 RepID=A0A2P7S2D1_9HYPH|nr:hypothetical protein C7I85_24020 [Mesorhizobium soli]
MNAFWASENFEAFIALRSSPNREITAENSNSERSSFRGSDQNSQWQVNPSKLQTDIDCQ